MRLSYSLLLLLLVGLVYARPLDDDNQAQEGDDKRDKISTVDPAANEEKPAGDTASVISDPAPDGAAADKSDDNAAKKDANPDSSNADDSATKNDADVDSSKADDNADKKDAGTDASADDNTAKKDAGTDSGSADDNSAKKDAGTNSDDGAKKDASTDSASDDGAKKDASVDGANNNDNNTTDNSSKKDGSADDSASKKDETDALAGVETVNPTKDTTTVTGPTSTPKTTEKQTVEKSDNNTETMKGTTFHVAFRLLDEKFSDDLNYPVNPVYQSLKKHVMTMIADVYKDYKDDQFKQSVVIKFSDGDKKGDGSGGDDIAKRNDVAGGGVVVDLYLRFFTAGTHLKKLNEAIATGKLGTHDVSTLFVRAYVAEPKGRVCTPDCKIQCYSYCDAGCCHLDVIQHIELPPESPVDNFIQQQKQDMQCQGAACAQAQPMASPCQGASCAPPMQQMPCQGASCAPPMQQMPCQGASCAPPMQQMPCQGASCAPPMQQMPCQGATCPPAMPQMPCQGASCAPQMPVQMPCQGAACSPQMPAPQAPCRGSACAQPMAPPMCQGPSCGPPMAPPQMPCQGPACSQPMAAPCRGASCSPPMMQPVPFMNYPPMQAPMQCQPSCSQVCAPSCPSQCCGLQQSPMFAPPARCGPRGC